MNKKADIGAGLILLILISLLFVSAVMTTSTRECSSSADCKDNHYCGSDFACHEHPTIQTTVTKVSYTGPIAIVAITAIILAIIFRWEAIFHRSKKKSEPSETQEPYYSSQFKYTAK